VWWCANERVLEWRARIGNGPVLESCEDLIAEDAGVIGHGFRSQHTAAGAFALARARFDVARGRWIRMVEIVVVMGVAGS
jgi:hypothetical protein